MLQLTARLQASLLDLAPAQPRSQWQKHNEWCPIALALSARADAVRLAHLPPAFQPDQRGSALKLGPQLELLKSQLFNRNKTLLAFRGGAQP